MESFKIRDAFQNETISYKSFKQEIDFKEVNGFIVIEAEFNGQLRNFIFDTGASVILDTDFAESIQTVKIGRLKTVDSNNKKRKVPYVKIKEIKIGEVLFQNTVGSVSNLNHINEGACSDISGIIGANLMNKCIWQIDYAQKKIILTNEIDSLNLSGKEQKIKFSAVGKGVPTVSLFANGLFCGEALFDTGFNGTFLVNSNCLIDTTGLVEKEVSSAGVFGFETILIKTRIIDSIQLTSAVTYKNQFVNFEENVKRALIGNSFLKDYKVTFDWKSNEILLEKYSNQAYETPIDFGFHPKFIHQKIVIGSIRKNSKAYEEGLRLNDQIISWNGIDYTTETYDKYCKHSQNCKDISIATLTVLRAEKKLIFNLEKSEVLE